MIDQCQTRLALVDQKQKALDRRVAQTRDRLETYEQYDIRRAKAALVNTYNGLLNEVLTQVDDHRWTKSDMVDFRDRVIELGKQVKALTQQAGIDRSQLRIRQGIYYMLADIDDTINRTRGWLGRDRVQLIYNPTTLAAYKSYWITDFDCPALALSNERRAAV